MPSQLQIYSDGGSRGNPGPAAIGFVICDHHGTEIKDYKETIGKATNNVAEYTAVIKALEMARELQGEEIDYYMDSELVQRQLVGEYRVKHPDMYQLYRKVKDLEKYFRKITYNHVRREHNMIQLADRLVNRALDEAKI